MKLQNNKDKDKYSGNAKIERKTTAPTENKDYSIKPNDRVFVCGKTGSGKTTLVKYLLATAKRLIVIDGKDGIRDKWNLEDYKANRENKNRIINNEDFRFRLINNYEDIIEVLNLVYDTGNIDDTRPVIIYIDEIVATIPNPKKVPQIFIDLLQRGRSRKIGVWGNTQRPVNVPKVFISEAEHIFLFTLNLEDDRKAVASSVGKAAMIKPTDTYGFYYYNLNDNKLTYYKRLNI